MAKYAMTDIHGCLETFKAMLDHLNFSITDELYLLGDYVDRGPDSKGVIDHIWALQKSGYAVFCLRGNHEQMMLRSVDDYETEVAWKRHGGKETLVSFNVSKDRDVPKIYHQWMKELPYYFEVDQYILVHGGLEFKGATPFEDAEALLWKRHWYHEIDKAWLGDRHIIHGHTPMEKQTIIDQLENIDIGHVLDLDNGCVYDKPGKGNLCAFDMNKRVLHFLARLD